MDANQQCYRKIIIENSNDNSKVNGWKHDRSKSRYRNVFDLIDFDPGNPLSLCELGYGSGYGYHLLSKRFKGMEVTYTGYDYHEDYFNLATKRYNGDFRLGSFKDIEDGVYDYIYAVGVFTLNRASRLLPYFIEQMNSMLLKSKKGIIINGFHKGADCQESQLFYFDLNDLILCFSKYNVRLIVVEEHNHEFFMRIVK